MSLSESPELNERDRYDFSRRISSLRLSSWDVCMNDASSGVAGFSGSVAGFESLGTAGGGLLGSMAQADNEKLNSATTMRIVFSLVFVSASGPPTFRCCDCHP